VPVPLVALVPLVVGLALAAVGTLGFLERLPRNRFVGVRTPATLRDDETFRVGNKVAGLPVAVGGGVGVAGGAVALTLTGAAALVVALVALAGLAVIATAGGVLGHRAAEAVPEPEPELPAGCAGCQCGGCGIAKSVGAKSVGANVAGVGGE
jgi:SdpI/YhfL family protein